MRPCSSDSLYLSWSTSLCFTWPTLRRRWHGNILPKLLTFTYISACSPLHHAFVSCHKHFCAISYFLSYIGFYNEQSLPQNIPIKFRFLSTAFNDVCLSGYSKYILNLHLFSGFVHIVTWQSMTVLETYWLRLLLSLYLFHALFIVQPSSIKYTKF